MSDPNTPPPEGGGFTPPPPPPPGGSVPPPPPGPPQAPPPGAGGYGGPPGGFTPPPAQPYGGGNVPQLDVGAAVSYGWSKFQQYAKEFILLVLAVFVAVVVISLLAFIVIIPAATSDSVLLTAIVQSFAGVLIMAVGFIVQAGVYRAGLEVTRGRAPDIAMLTDTTNLVPYVLTVLLVSVGTLIGLVLCIIPGIIWLFFTAYAPLMALDKGTDPVEAIKSSIAMVRENLGAVFLVLLASYAIYYVGALLCYVGLLVTIPVALVTITYSYRALNNEPVAP